MKTFAIFALIFATAGAAVAASTVTVLSPAAEFGQLNPESGPAVASLNVIVRSDVTWRLAVLRDLSPRQRAVRAGGAIAGNDVLVRSEEGTWSPLLSGIAIPIASGTATDNAAGSLRSIDFQMTPTMDMTPGARQCGLHLLLNGQSAATVPLAYAIAPSMNVKADDREFRLVTNDPSHPRSYDFEPRIYIVTSNVPWVLETYVSSPPKAAGESTVLSNDSLRVIAADGRQMPLVAGGPSVIVATGPPTGRVGFPVQLRLTVVAGGAAPEGAYKTQLEFRIKQRG